MEFRQRWRTQTIPLGDVSHCIHCAAHLVGCSSYSLLFSYTFLTRLIERVRVASLAADISHPESSFIMTYGLENSIPLYCSALLVPKGFNLNVQSHLPLLVA